MLHDTEPSCIFQRMTGKRKQARRPAVPKDAVVVARVGDRTIYAPRNCRLNGTELHEEGVRIESLDVEIVNGRPVIRGLRLEAYKELTPLGMQRLPWARLAESAIEASAVEVGTAGKTRRASGRQVRDARQRSRRVGQATDGKWTPIGEDRLRRVLELRAEAQRLGVRWDTYAAEKMHYTPAYLRKLAGRAKSQQKGGKS